MKPWHAQDAQDAQSLSILAFLSIVLDARDAQAPRPWSILSIVWACLYRMQTCQALCDNNQATMLC
jgi:hypothetical protein